MKKFALFVFNGDPMCFIHVLLNALDMKDRGHEAKIVIEGAATNLIADLAEERHPLYKLWEQAKEKGLVEGTCKACTNKMGTIESSKRQNIPLLDDMSGHPGMAHYYNKGYEIITF